MKEDIKRLVLSSLFSTILSVSAFASRIVGGDIAVKYLSPNNYEVKVTFFRDCSGSGATFDDPMYIDVYDKVTHVQ